MVFNSAEFILLFALVVPLYFALPYRHRNALLLTASAVFYMWWRPEYIALILFSTGIDWVVCLGLMRTDRKGWRRALLLTSLASNLGLLFFFKYFGFACDVLRTLLGAFHADIVPPAMEVVLPIGISFYTFQALSYTVDVYRGDIAAERSFPRLFLYVLFFPQLVAGPIERSTRLLPQFSERHDFDERAAAEGCRRIVWGLIKKVVVADRLAVLVQAVYARPSEYSGLTLVVATYAFAVQIYCDFSGYSDIAVGTARILGFRLMENFEAPYLSTSIPDFWRRWHVSLSTWFRDYVYVPLGGSRSSAGRASLNLLVTFLLSGLWHGAKWTFVLWGLYHGVLMVLSRRTEGFRSRLADRFGVALPAWARTLVVFHLVLLGWVFFRAATLSDALYVLRHAFDGFPALALANLPADVSFLAGIVPVFLVLEWLNSRTPLWQRMATLPLAVRGAADVVAVLALLNFAADIESPFIYFQF